MPKTSENKIQKIINELIQLQELIIARHQHQTVKKNPHIKDLSHAIETMTEELPEGLKSHFQKLLEKNLVAIAPIAEEKCSGCGMSLPHSLVNSVHAAQQLFRCPTCTRILYYRETEVKRIPTERRRRFAPKLVGLERFSSQKLMIASLCGETMEEVLAEICEKMESEGFVESKEMLLNKALERESIISTAVDHGIAFPHVRGVEGGGLTLCVGIHKKGIKFNPEGSRLTRIFLFMAIPTAASAFYLKLVAGLAEVLHDKDTREAIAKAKEPEELWELLCEATAGHID
jgi:mannitol/fructose-specific phosphotransferase system IIA component (Ntr-type)